MSSDDDDEEMDEMGTFKFNYVSYHLFILSFLGQIESNHLLSMKSIFRTPNGIISRYLSYMAGATSTMIFNFLSLGSPHLKFYKIFVEDKLDFVDL